MLGLGLYEEQVCDCGFHETVRGDPTNVIVPEKRVCPVCAGAAKYGRMLVDEDEEWDTSHKDASPTVARPADGRRVYLRHLTPAQAEAERQRQQRKGGEPGGDTPRKGRPRAR